LTLAKYRVSIDIGGTFTDLVALKEESGELVNIKIPSTPREPERAVIRTFQDFLRKTGDAEISVVIHATTMATNALLGQLNLELPKTALITTKGFRDIIEIGRQRRHQLYNLFIRLAHSFHEHCALKLKNAQDRKAKFLHPSTRIKLKD